MTHIALLLVLTGAVVLFWFGRASVGPVDEDAPFADLWLYQQALSDCGHRVEGLTSDDHADLARAHAAAYPRAEYLRPEAWFLLTRLSLPDLDKPGMDLVDLAHAYLAASERLADEIVRAQFGDRWHPSMLKANVAAAHLRTAS